MNNGCSFVSVVWTRKSLSFYIKIKMLTAGLEPATSSLPRKCATYCATRAKTRAEALAALVLLVLPRNFEVNHITGTRQLCSHSDIKCWFINRCWCNCCFNGCFRSRCCWRYCCFNCCCWCFCCSCYFVSIRCRRQRC